MPDRGLEPVPLVRPAVLEATDSQAVDAAAMALDAGGIVGIPTETVYGLAVLPRPAPLALLIEAKGRSLRKGITLLVDGLDQVAPLVVIPALAGRLAARFWPGALTLVLPLREGVTLPVALTGGAAALGVRVPDHDTPRSLARRLGPLAVSSANRSGRPDARTVAELLASVGDSVALVIDDGPVRGGVPSTVVRVSVEGELTVLRHGALSADELRRVARASR